MKIRVKDTVALGIHSYKVKFSPFLNSEVWGVSSHSGQTLDLKSDLPYSQQVVTYFHELCHIIGFCLLDGEDWLSERQCTALGEGLAQWQQHLGIELDFSGLKSKGR